MKSIKGLLDGPAADSMADAVRLLALPGAGACRYGV